MKILHVLDHSAPFQSGYAFRSRAILLEQKRLGWQTWQVTSTKHGIAVPGSDRTLLEEEVDGLHFYRTPGAAPFLERLPLINQLAVVLHLKRRLGEVIELVRPDIIHAHSPLLNGLAALSVARRAGLPVVYEVRAFWEDAAVDLGRCREGDLRYRLTRGIETYVLQNVGAITCICNGLRDDIVCRGIVEEKISVIPNAVDIVEFSAKATRDEALASALGIETNLVLGFVGSFHSYEGLALLLGAMPAVLKRYPEVRVLLVGGGKEEENLRRLARELGLSEKVVFAGRVPHDQVSRYYSLMKLLIYPRLRIRLTETVTPLKPLEAMAQGKLVIASDVGGHRELIRDNETGWLFRAGDTGDLERCIVQVLAERQRWESVLLSARAFVEHERSWKKSVRGYEPVYGSLRVHRASERSPSTGR